MKPVRSLPTKFQICRSLERSTRRTLVGHRTIRLPALIGRTCLLIACGSFSLLGYGQALEVSDSKGTVRAAFVTGDQVQIVFRHAPSEIRTTTGLLGGIRLDSLTLVDFSGAPQGVALARITGVRRLPTVINGLAAGVALGGTVITISTNRELPAAPQAVLSLLIGAGVGAGVTYWQRSRHPKRVRYRTERGWSFQVR